MRRRGRPRKFGQRDNHGDLVRDRTAEHIDEISQRESDENMLVVLSQPHRRGNRDQLCGDALGRFVLRNKLRREIYDAGHQYGGIVRAFYLANCIGSPIVRCGLSSLWIPRGQDIAAGTPLTEEQARQLKSRLNRAERVMKENSKIGFSGVKLLIIEDRDVDNWIVSPVIWTLMALAVDLGFLSTKLQPFDFGLDKHIRNQLRAENSKSRSAPQLRIPSPRR